MSYRANTRIEAQNLTSKLIPSLTNTRTSKGPSKAKTTISTAKILKRKKPIKETYGKKHSHRNGRHLTKNDAVLEYQEAIEVSRATINAEAKDSLKSTNVELNANLIALGRSSATFLEETHEKRAGILLPLTKDQIQSTFTRGGKSMTQTVAMAERVEIFDSATKQSIVDLRKLWAEWEEVQKDIVELGVEVLGHQAFEDGYKLDKVEERGFSRAMEVWNLEHEGRLEEMREEIKNIGKVAVSKMKTAEKEHDLQLKKDQAAMLTTMFGI